MFDDLRVVFQDIDGCMNTPDASDLSAGPEGGLTRGQRALLREIGEAIDASSVELVVFNTGRTHQAVGYIADAIGSEKARYWVTEHGAYACDAASGAAIDLASAARAQGLFEVAARYESVRRIAQVIEWYNAHGVVRLRDRLGRSLPALPKAANLTVAVPAGMDGPELIAAIADVLFEAQEVESDGLVFHHNAYYVDVISQVGKGDGALGLLAHLGIDPAHALVVGDGLNDLSMFEVIGRGFCPANADPALKALCLDRGGMVSEHAFGRATIDLYRRLR